MRATALLAASLALVAFAPDALARKAKPAPAPADEPVPVEAPAAPSDAEPSEADLDAAAAKEQAEFESHLTWKTGTISLVNGKVQLALPEGYRFLGPDDAEKVLVQWGNPKGDPPLGMLIPRGSGLWDDTSLAILVEYNDDGHVSDDDAAKTDFGQLLAQMKDATRQGSAERVKQGLAAMTLVGWAEAPHYDRSSRKLYWAKELEFDGSSVHTLNYDVRVLGREGALELSAIASIAQLEPARVEMQKVLGFADFTKENLYTDYKEGSDKAAGYGIAGVVAGGLALKAIGGKGFIAILLAAKKLILAGLVAAAAFLKAIWAKLTGKKAPPAETPPPPTGHNFG
jgi:uncharacterized membrane-anchored protein